MRILLTILILFNFVFAGSTSVRFIIQKQANLNTMSKQQIGVETFVDTALGFHMWGGKDTSGTVYRFLGKDRNARTLKHWSDTNYSKTDTSATMRTGIGTADSLFSRAINTSKLYFGTLTGGTKISADTIQAVHLLNLTQHGGSHFTGDGDVYYDSIHAGLESFTNGNSGTFNRCIFAQTNVPLCSNTVTETSLKGVDSILIVDFPAILDSLSANWFKKGKRLRFGIAGVYSTKATSPGTLIIRLKLNNTLIDSCVAALDASEVDQYWRMDGAIICASTGVSGSVRNITSFNHIILSAGQNILHGETIYTLGTTINTTIRQRFNITAQFSLADVANKIRSIVFYTEEIH